MILSYQLAKEVVMKYALIVLLCAQLVHAGEVLPGAGDRPAPLPYVISMVHHNPGEPAFITKFEQPAYLRQLGINGDVPRFFFQCGVVYDQYESGLIPQSGASWAWIQRNALNLDHLLDGYHVEELPIFPFTDVLVVPKEILDKYGSEMRDEKGRLSIQRPRTQSIMRAQVINVFRRFPGLDGLTIRFGETYLCDTPFHTGNRPVHSPADHTLLINLLREEVCVKLNKKLIYRTWDFGQLHTNPALYLEATDPVVPHDNLLFSIKHTNDDYLRNVPFNKTLGIGKHRQIVEISMMQAGCYGKGAYPYYLGHGVLHGWSEMKERKGIDTLVHGGRLAGVFVWPRGDGWSGPYIANEFWVDINMYVICQFAKRPWMNDEQLFKEYCLEKLHLDDSSTEKLYEICLLSSEATLHGAQSVAGNIQAWWQRDDKLNDVNLRRADRGKVMVEKASAVAEWKRIEALARELHLKNTADQEFVEVSSTYGRIYFSIIEQLWELNFLSYLDLNGNVIEEMRMAIKRYDELWKEWESLERAHGCCPTLYMTCWPQTYPPVWRERPANGRVVPSRDTPVVAQCRAAIK